MCMPEDHRPPRPDVVDEFPAILGFEPRTASAPDEQRLAADRGERTHRRIHASGNVFPGFLDPRHAMLLSIVAACYRSPAQRDTLRFILLK
jgi:hypothetical protein